MIDIKFLRENPDVVRENIKKKFQDSKLPLVDEVIALDKEYRENKTQADNLRASRNKVSKQIGMFMAQGKKDEAEEAKKIVAQQAEELKNALSELNTQLEVVKTDLSDKVHSENVQCYRNLADLLKSVEAKLDKANEIEKKVISVHKCTKAVIVFSVINMLGLIGIAALMIYQMLF